MPLLDHFHPPLSIRRHWDAFHATWAVRLADALNAVLPAEYFAEPHTHAGASAEIDVATFDESADGRNGPASATGTAAPPQTSTVPSPTLTMPASFPSGFEVRVISTKAGPTLVAAIELVSPRTKDRPKSRRAFATKCANYLYQGISLIVADIVTERTANLHNETMRLMEAADPFHLPADAALYAVAYRPARRDDKEEIDLWPARLAVGEPLPVLPLVLGRDLALPVDLETAYQATCQHLRLI